jgi:hypothetical protein
LFNETPTAAPTDPGLAVRAVWWDFSLFMLEK